MRLFDILLQQSKTFVLNLLLGTKKQLTFLISLGYVFIYIDAN